MSGSIPSLTSNVLRFGDRHHDGHDRCNAGYNSKRKNRTYAQFFCHRHLNFPQYNHRGGEKSKVKNDIEIYPNLARQDIRAAFHGRLVLPSLDQIEIPSGRVAAKTVMKNECHKLSKKQEKKNVIDPQPGFGL